MCECTDSIISERHFCPEMEFLMVKCRSFYPPREFSTVFITAVNVYSQANARPALDKLHDAISTNVNKHPESGLL